MRSSRPLSSSGPARWERIRALFGAALDRPPGAARDGWLREACGGNDALYADVAALLAADAEESSPLDRDPAAVLGAVTPPAPLAGRVVGPYRIISELGRGGMGAVYLAERDDVRRRVALKAVRGDLAAPEHRARFLFERRALARLEHPNIARLLDAGVAEDGTPWFAMELVDGEPITAHADRHALDAPGRVALFAQACEAVRHAHGRLVVHRDLKPSNILVTVAGEVKLLDFGIAKLLGGDDVDRDNLTHTGARLMTPEYAAPEQVLGEPVTTATDVYGLGVVLYELLAGRRAFDGAGGLPGAVQQRVLSTDPPRPSTVRAAAARAGGDAATVRADADLDAVVARAMRKSPAERYPTVDALLDDVRRWGQGRPVLARRGSAAYRARKFAARHRAGLAATVLAAGALTGLGVREGVLRARAERLRDEARATAAASERLTGFLTGLFTEVDPFTAGAGRPDTMRVRDFVLARGARVAALDADPEVGRRALTAVGRMYVSVSAGDSARPLLERALALGRRLHPEGDAETLRTLNVLGMYHYERNEYAPAERYLREARVLGARLYPAPHPDVVGTLHALTDVLRQREAFAEGVEVSREEVRLTRALNGPRSREYADALNNLGLILLARGAYAEAEPVLREALGRNRVALPADHPATAATLTNLGILLRRTGRPADAEPAFREALAMKQRRFGATHWRVANGMAQLGLTLADLGRLDEAEQTLRTVLALQRGRDRERSESVGMAHRNLGDVLRRRGALDEAEREARAGAETLRAVMPPGNIVAQEALVVLGRVLTARGRPREACGPGPLDSAYAALRARLGDGDPRAADAASALGGCLVARRR